MGFLSRHRIGLIVAGVIVFVLVTPLVPALSSILPWSVVVCCLGISAWSWNASRFDRYLAFLVAVDFALVRLFFPHTDPPLVTLRAAAITGYVLFHVVLLIGPWSRFVPKVRAWYRHRRHLGVTVFFLAFLHASLVFTFEFLNNVENAWSATFVAFGTIALFVLAIIAAISWDWFQKHVSMTQWKVIHAVTLLLFLAELFAIWSTWQRLGIAAPIWALVAFVAFIVYWMAVAPWGLVPRMMKVVHGWKQMHVLIYIAYIALVLHVYFGAAMLFGDSWAQPFVLILFQIVAISHLAGWIRAWRERKRLAVAEPAKEPWHDVCALSELEPEVGRRFDIHGLPVAVFLHEGNVLAYFGYCCHQKGPLWQGKIIDGYLTCPWHSYQFSVKDGKGPPGYDDAVPMYQTTVEKGRVLVKMEKGTECRGFACRGCACRGVRSA